MVVVTETAETGTHICSCIESSKMSWLAEQALSKSSGVVGYKEWIYVYALLVLMLMLLSKCHTLCYSAVHFSCVGRKTWHAQVGVNTIYASNELVMLAHDLGLLASKLVLLDDKAGVSVAYIAAGDSGELERCWWCSTATDLHW